jgi:hypothetical protein
MKAVFDKRPTTKGGIVLEEINIGDVQFEYEYGVGIRSVVQTKPVRNDKGQWFWQNKIESNEQVINYLVAEGMSHYGPNLYNYEAYQVKSMIK